MIDMPEAVAKSREALKETFEVADSTPLELEEVELDDDYWVVTFSYPKLDAGELAENLGPNLRAILSRRRYYKSVRLLAKDGSIRGVKNLPV